MTYGIEGVIVLLSAPLLRRISDEVCIVNLACAAYILPVILLEEAFRFGGHGSRTYGVDCSTLLSSESVCINGTCRE